MKHLLRRIVLSSAAVLGTLTAMQANTPADVADPHMYGGNYYCYPWLNETPPALTPAPRGYKPFHIEHYGRHGSRWLIGDSYYGVAVAELAKAERNGKLTPYGQEMLDTLRKIERAAYKRDGELSDLGALQHQGIGKRMVHNFPQVFNPSTRIDARSTVVIRSILSMFNGLNGIQSVVPDIKIRTDASEADMRYMNNSVQAILDARSRADSIHGKPFRKAHKIKGDFMAKLISDPKFAKDSIGMTTLYNAMHSILVNTQSHSDQPWLFEDLFTPDEMRSRWLVRNYNWFNRSGNSANTSNIAPYNQANLLRNIIASADTTLASPNLSVNLRYGHDTIILPLTVLLELGDYGKEYNDPEEVAAAGWHDYKIIPMAANIQIVFYRPEAPAKGDVLVKVLLNEQEMPLPLTPVAGPYYKWQDFKDYYLSKLDAFDRKVGKSE